MDGLKKLRFDIEIVGQPFMIRFNDVLTILAIKLLILNNYG